MNSTLYRFARVLLGFAVLLGAAGSAFAAGNTIAAPGMGANSAWTVYAFGNAQAVADIFRALANFTSSSTFRAIISMVAVIGIIAVGASSGFNPAVAKRFISYIVGVFLISYVFIGANNGGPLVIQAEVIDSVDMTWKAPVTVPAIVGIPASVISSAGYSITKAIEASFPLPDELKMSNGAPFNLAAGMLADASQARITDPNLASSLAYYVQDCFTLGVAQGALRADTLLWSTNFLADIKFDSKAIMVNTLLDAPVGSPGIVSCAVAWDLINKAVTAQGGTASSFLQDASAWSRTPAMSVLNAAADVTAQWATNNGVTDGAAMVKQAAVLSAFRGSYSQAAAQTGNSEFLTGLAMTQATESQRTSWVTGAEVFNKTMGYIFAIIQVFVYGITPLVMCAALVPGLGMALLKNFAQILLWLAIWQPMLAIVNFIVISMQQSELGGVLSNGAGDYGFTMSNMGLISEKTANLRAAATFVGTMVPALAWAMVKGSVDFSRVISSAAGENFAAGAANTMTTGNYSLNQASMDSFTSNKHSVAATGAWGGGHTTNGAVGSKTNNLGGNELPSIGEQRANIASSKALSVGENGSHGTAAMYGKSGLQSTGTSNTAAINDSVQHTTTGGKAYTAGTTVSGTLGGNAGVTVSPPGKGGAPVVAPGSAIPAVPGGAAVPGAQGKEGTTQPSKTNAKQPMNLGPFKPSAGATLSGAHVTQRAEADNYSNMDSRAHGATITNAATDSKMASDNASVNKSANHSNMYSASKNQVITAPTSAADRAALQESIMTPGSNFLTSWGDETPAPAPAHNPIADTARELGTSGAVPNAVAAEKQKVAAEENRIEKKTDKLRGDAVKGNNSLEKAAGGELAAGKGKLDAALDNATTGVLERIGDKLGDTGADLLKTMKEYTPDAVLKALGDSGDAKDAKPATPPSKHAHATPAPQSTKLAENTTKGPTAGKQTGDQEKPNAGDQAQPTKLASAAQPGRENGNPAGKQTGENEKPNAGDLTQPTKLASAAQPGRENGNPAGKQTGENEKPNAGDQTQPTYVAANTPNDRNHGKPEAHAPRDTQAAAPHDDKQAKPEQARGGEPATMVAAANPSPQQDSAQAQAQAMALAMAQAISQAQSAAQGAALAPSQVAGAQLPGAATGMPNPFGGEKSEGDPAQMQSQLMVAEQRADHLENQRRSADGLLASAESRDAKELPELINQARDFTRNA